MISVNNYDPFLGAFDELTGNDALANEFAKRRGGYVFSRANGDRQSQGVEGLDGLLCVNLAYALLGLGFKDSASPVYNHFPAFTDLFEDIGPKLRFDLLQVVELFGEDSHSVDGFDVGC